MVDYSSSFIVVNEVLEKSALNNNAQFPYLFFSGVNCTGLSYPTTEDRSPLWNQDLTASLIGFSTIASLYVPPHAKLEMWNSVNGDGYYAVQGPVIIPNTAAQLAVWSNYDGSPCLESSKACGTRVGNNKGWILGVNIFRMRITWNTSWTQFLHDSASNHQRVQMGDSTYSIDYDALFNEICPDPLSRYSCNCHSAYQDLLIKHPAAANQSFVNITPNGCNSNTMYVPSKANIGTGTTQECLQMINAQLKSGTFPTLSNGGQTLYPCATKLFVNGTVDNTQALKTVSVESSSSSSSGLYVYYIIGAVTLMLLLFMLFMTRFVVIRERSHLKTANKHRKNKVNF